MVEINLAVVRTISLTCLSIITDEIIFIFMKNILKGGIPAKLASLKPKIKASRLAKIVSSKRLREFHSFSNQNTQKLLK